MAGGGARGSSWRDFAGGESSRVDDSQLDDGRWVDRTAVSLAANAAHAGLLGFLADSEVVFSVEESIYVIIIIFFKRWYSQSVAVKSIVRLWARGGVDRHKMWGRGGEGDVVGLQVSFE